MHSILTICSVDGICSGVYFSLQASEYFTVKRSINKSLLDATFKYKVRVESDDCSQNEINDLGVLCGNSLLFACFDNCM